MPKTFLYLIMPTNLLLVHARPASPPLLPPSLPACPIKRRSINFLRLLLQRSPNPCSLWLGNTPKKCLFFVRVVGIHTCLSPSPSPAPHSLSSLSLTLTLI